MEPLMELAGATAAALVEAIAKKETWSSARRAVVALFSRHDAQRAELIDKDLNYAEAQMAAAGSDGLATIQPILTGMWTGQFNMLLQDRPQAAEELKKLLALLTPDADPGAPKPNKMIQQTATASGGGIVNQVGEFTGGAGGVTFTIGAGVPAQSPPPVAEA